MPYDPLTFKTESRKLIDAVLDAVDPAKAVRAHLQRTAHTLQANGTDFYFSTFDQIVIVAVGKAAVPMAAATCDVIGDKLARLIIVTKQGHAGDACRTLAQRYSDRTTVIEAAHPVPDENSLRAGEIVTEALTGLGERTLVIACISGGASALMISPHTGIRLETMQAINDALLRCGADIREMNAVRSRLDRLKGGGLARVAAPAPVLALILSDVVGDPLDVIASGLTNDRRAHNVLVANNKRACEAALAAARGMGFQPRIVTTEMRGEASERGREIARAIRAQPSGTCLIYGGETTVTIHGAGQGGRNQELALAAAIELGAAAAEPCTLIALGTDGTDGPNDAAGALLMPDTLARAGALNLPAAEYLANNDSYNFFNQLGDLIMTGPTGTNVADVVIAMHW